MKACSGCTVVTAAIVALLSLVRQTAANAAQDNACVADKDTQQTCSWLENCSVPDCSSTCIVNIDRMKNDVIMTDRQYAEGAWNMCPELALWVDLTQPAGQPDMTQASRRLQQTGQQTHARSLVRHYLSELASRMHKSTSMHASSDANLQASGSFRPRRLMEASGDDAASEPAATSLGASVPEEYTVECPADEVLDNSASQLMQWGEEIEAAIREFIFTQAVQPDTAPFWTDISSQLGYSGNMTADIPEHPNLLLIMMEYLQDPVKLKEYINANCADRVVTMNGVDPISAQLLHTNTSKLPDDGVFKLCLDKSGAWDQFYLGVTGMRSACDFPFGSQCYSQAAFAGIVSSEECAMQWAATVNVSLPSTFTMLAEVNQQAHAACSALTTKEECTQTDAPELEAPALHSMRLQASLPFHSQHELAEPLYAILMQPLMDQAVRTTGNPDVPISSITGSNVSVVSGGESMYSAPSRMVENPGDDGRYGGASVWVVVGPVLAAGVLVVLAGVLGVVCIRRRQKLNQQRGNAPWEGFVQRKRSKESTEPAQSQSQSMVLADTASMSTNEGKVNITNNNYLQKQPSKKLPSLQPPLALGAALTSIGSQDRQGSFAFESTSLSGTKCMHVAPLGSEGMEMQTVNSEMHMHQEAMHVEHALSPEQPPAEPYHSRAAEITGHVCQVLDFMHDQGQVFGTRYNLHGPRDRSFGSYGLVQMASIRVLQDPVAIKIFTDPLGFANEERAYNVKAVADAVGTSPVFMPNTDCTAAMPDGFPFPPFTVAEKGQPLDMWMQRFSADPITSMQVLGQVLKALKALHEAGYAHRNIKPSNIIQREKQHDWVLSDFASCCPLNRMESCNADVSAPLPSSVSSLPYTAPEVLASADRGKSSPPSARASTAADMWALGVVAFELLTNERAFPPFTPPEAIRAALAGGAPLPWEDGTVGAEYRRRRLRGLKRVVLGCLSRDPSQRPRAQTVLKSWHKMLDDMKTRGTFDSTSLASSSSQLKEVQENPLYQGPVGTPRAASVVSNASAGAPSVQAQTSIDETTRGRTLQMSTVTSSVCTEQDKLSSKEAADKGSTSHGSTSRGWFQLTGAREVGAREMFSAHSFTCESFRSARDTFEVTQDQETFESARGTTEFMGDSGRGWGVDVTGSSKVFGTPLKS